MSTENPIVTLDGPAGSGKSSTAKEVARRLSFRHLDSGALYRALTLALHQKGLGSPDWQDLTEEELASLDVDVRPTETGYEVRVDDAVVDAELRTARVTADVSRLAALPQVRKRLLSLQRRAGEAGRLVADGRDMGTVVFPDADVKVFLVADVEERARRRLREEGGPETDEELARQVASIRERDARDAGREISPLKRADDAYVIDTTSMDFEGQVEAVVELVRRRTAGG